MATNRAVALRAYKNLLQAQRQTFGSDLVTLQAARAKTYNEFNNYKNESDPAVVEEKINLANQVASILRSNIVQGVRKEQKDDIYQLKFHSGIELGDNDSIRKAKGSHKKSKKSAAATGCCGGQ
ncbi:hypothetical protein INT43_008930 [Umbelopsis isabellina]|uniref:Mitochondrial zinc maintenance protein 1, mitochondrial n=1 Tax=Mortierella isabellina TaxID=91625 RepID=A0A8H7PVZ0_MORIS|nr:hypothetical protein INT43_008930 [Umbelopsis isabellina]